MTIRIFLLELNEEEAFEPNRIIICSENEQIARNSVRSIPTMEKNEKDFRDGIDQPFLNSARYTISEITDECEIKPSPGVIQIRIQGKIFVMRPNQPFNFDTERLITFIIPSIDQQVR